MSSGICKIAHLSGVDKAHIIFLGGEIFPGVKYTKGAYAYNGTHTDARVYECILRHDRSSKVTKMNLIGEMYDNNALYQYTSYVKDGKLYVTLEPLLA